MVQIYNLCFVLGFTSLWCSAAVVLLYLSKWLILRVVSSNNYSWCYWVELLTVAVCLVTAVCCYVVYSHFNFYHEQSSDLWLLIYFFNNDLTSGLDYNNSSLFYLLPICTLICLTSFPESTIYAATIGLALLIMCERYEMNHNLPNTNTNQSLLNFYPNLLLALLVCQIPFVNSIPIFVVTLVILRSVLKRILPNIMPYLLQLELFIDGIVPLSYLYNTCLLVILFWSSYTLWESYDFSIVNFTNDITGWDSWDISNYFK